MPESCAEADSTNVAGVRESCSALPTATRRPRRRGFPLAEASAVFGPIEQPAHGSGDLVLACSQVRQLRHHPGKLGSKA